MRRNLLSIAIAVLASILAVLLLTSALSARSLSARSLSAHTGETTMAVGAFSPAEDQDSTPLGEPCGCGEQLPPWVLCLHGTVSLIHPSGQVELLDGIPITITWGTGLVTGTTFVHPGYVTPTYGIDISPLAPAFLEPVTLTALVGNTTVQRQVLVFPDFATQSQRHDLHVMAVTALDPAPVWGHVVAFGEGGPVAGATVTAEHGGASVVVTSTEQLSASLPIYAFSSADLASIDAGPGSTITLTARYQGDADQRVVALAGTSQQVDLVTGWMCDDFDPLPRTSGGHFLPRTSGGHFLPRTSGGHFLPDVACFWGYGVVDGVPLEGVSVRLVISDTVYEGQTHLYPGETVPRYGIGVWGSQAISGQVAVATGVYSGYTAVAVTTVTLDANLSQRVDLFVESGSRALANLTNVQYVRAAFRHGGYLWIGTTGGVVRLDPSDGSTVQLTTVDGLTHNDVRTIAADRGGSLWFGTMSGASRYTPDTGVWETFFDSPYHTVNAIALAPDDALWFATSGGLSRYTPGTGEWVSYPITDSLPADCVYDMALGPDGSVWLATGGGAGRYFPATGAWEVFTTTAGLVSDEVNAVAVGADGSAWFGTPVGASHYTPIGGTWETYTTAHGLIDDMVDVVAIGQDGSVWFGSTWGTGVSHYTPASSAWETFTAGDGLISDQIMAIVPDADGSLWFVGFGCGVSHYVPAGGEWTTYTIAVELVDNTVKAIAIDAGGVLWFGTSRGVSRYTPATGAWTTWTTSDGLIGSNVRAVAIAADGSVWFGVTGGANHYAPVSDTWQSFTTTHGLADNGVQAVAVAPDGSVWFGTAGGVSRYAPVSDTWQTFTTTHGLADDDVRAVAVAPDGALWFGTADGVSRYAPVSDTWQTFTTTHGLADDDVRAVAVAPDGALWFGTADGVSRHVPGTGVWEAFTSSDGLNSHDVRALAVGADGSVWFATSNGASHYVPGGNPEWETLTAGDGLASNRLQTVVVGDDGSVWFGTDCGVSHWQYTPPESDLVLQMSGPAAALPGQLITYTLHLVNYGQIPAVNTILTLTLPVSATYLEASLSPSGTAPLTWSLGTISPTASLSLVVTATLDAAISPGTTLAAAAAAATTSDEAFLPNNATQVGFTVRDPDRADARVALSAPPLLVPGAQPRYRVWVDNTGGLDAQNATLVVTLPADLIYQAALPDPASVGQVLTWDLGTLPALGLPKDIVFTATVAGTVPPGIDLGVTAVVTTTSPDADPLNNTAIVTASTSLTDALTLFLVAPDRLAERYGASPLLAKLHILADHPRVRGVILDVDADPGVGAAYAAWDAAVPGSPGDWQSANAVAEGIKALIDQYTVAYPGLRYLVIVGGDEVIPFYRVKDRNPLMWRESRYRYQTPPGTVHAALAADMFLSDDFYADRIPTVPNSPFWTDDRPLYLPDFAIGRLVETPGEIIAVVDAFMASDGTIPLGPSLVGSVDLLTDDLGQAQCTAMSGDGLTVTCTTELDTLRQAFLGQPVGSTWATVHGNHFSLGTLYTTDVLNRTLPLSGTLLVATSCHTGLNVPASPAPQPDVDLPQVFAGRGGTIIAPTAYAYASSIGTGYSEALALELTDQLLAEQMQEIGSALVRAKHAYYADHAGWFDATDEKVLLSVTLYGLPMLRVSTPDAAAAVDAAEGPPVLRSTVRAGPPEVVTYTLGSLIFDQHVTSDGVYYDYDGQVIAQHGMPVQPAFQVPLDEIPSGYTPRGAVLRSADYAEHVAFDPVIVQSWAIGEERAGPLVEPSVALAGWDRDLPYALARFEGLTATAASLNLVPGIYDADRQVEYLFTDLVLEVLHGDGADQSAPAISSVFGQTAGGATRFDVAVSDAALFQVTVIYDDGQGHWRSLALSPSGGETWTGETTQPVVRFCVQAADMGGNVTTSAWMLLVRYYYLPIAFHTDW